MALLSAHEIIISDGAATPTYFLEIVGYRC